LFGGKLFGFDLIITWIGIFALWLRVYMRHNILVLLMFLGYVLLANVVVRKDALGLFAICSIFINFGDLLRIVSLSFWNGLNLVIWVSLPHWCWCRICCLKLRRPIKIEHDRSHISWDFLHWYWFLVWWDSITILSGIIKFYSAFFIFISFSSSIGSRQRFHIIKLLIVKLKHLHLIVVKLNVLVGEVEIWGRFGLMLWLLEALWITKQILFNIVILMINCFPRLLRSF